MVGLYPYLKLHILFNSNDLAIWSGFPDITHIKKIMADYRPLFFGYHDLVLSESCPISNSSKLLVKWIYGIIFGAIHEKMLSDTR